MTVRFIWFLMYLANLKLRSWNRSYALLVMRKLLQDWPLSKEEQKKRIMRLYDKDDQQQKGNNMERMIGSDSNEQNTAYQTLHDTHG